jgi:hypothetical protein
LEPFRCLVAPSHSQNTFHAVIVRETVPPDNFHLLLHVDGNANLSLLRHAVARWFPEPTISAWLLDCIEEK